MGQPTKGKSHEPTAIVYDALQYLAFDNVAAVAAAAANTTVQARLSLPTNFKIFGVYVNSSAIGTVIANHAVNVIMGNGAEGGTAPATYDPETSALTVAVAGQGMTTADTALTGFVADTPFQIVATNPDAVWPKGALLTLRVVTPSSTGAFTNLKVIVYGKPFDIQPTKPINATLNLTTDL